MTAIPAIVPQGKAFVSIQYPGMQHGRFNVNSAPIAHQITALWNEMGGNGVMHVQPEGYAQLTAMDLAEKYTSLADHIMVPTSLDMDFPAEFWESLQVARDEHMSIAYYDGTTYAINTGTATHPDVRFVYMPDDAGLITERVRSICEQTGADFYFGDNLSEFGSTLGKDKAESNMGRMSIGFRGDRKPPVKSEKAIGQYVRAVCEGAGTTIVGFEPIPDAQWKIGQMDAAYGSLTPLMQMVEWPELQSFPKATRPHSFVILNDYERNYTLDDIRAYIKLAWKKGYHAVITWWVLKIALEKAGLNVTAMLNESWDRYTDANGGG